MAIALGLAGALSLVGCLTQRAALPAEAPRSSVHVYVVNSGSGSISAYSLNTATGVLSEVGGSPFVAGANPQYVAADPTGRFLYAANSSSDTVSAYRINPDTGTLAALAGAPFATGTFPESLAVNPSGTYLYVSNWSSNNISAFAIDPDTGAIVPVAGSPFAAGARPDSLVISPRGDFLYVANGDSNNISAYAIDAASGALSAVNGSPFAAGLTPRGIAMDAGGKYLYMPGWSSDKIWAFTVDPDSGALAAVEGSPFAAAAGPRDVLAGPRGTFLYALDAEDDVSSYAVDTGSGALAAAGSPALAAGPKPRGLATDPSGRFLFAPNSGGSSVAVYAIDPASGELAAVTGSPFAAGLSPSCVAVAGPVRKAAASPRPALAVKARETGFSPRGDNQHSTIDFALVFGRVEAITGWKLEMVTQGGTQKQWAGGPADRPSTLSWDGLAEDGSPAPEGIYTARLAVSYGEASREEAKSRPFVLDISPPTGRVAFDPAALEPDVTGAVPPVKISIQGSSATARMSTWSLDIVDQDGNAFQSFQGKWPDTTTTWDGKSPAGEWVTPGQTCTGQAVITDEFGNTTKVTSTLSVAAIPESTPAPGGAAD
jgi:YVTN family beta-propeller protein